MSNLKGIEIMRIFKSIKNFVNKRNFGVRRADKSDVDFIAEQIFIGEREGNFLNNKSSENIDDLKWHISQVIAGVPVPTISYEGTPELEYQEYFIYGSKKTGSIGFFKFHEGNATYPLREIEIRLLSMDEKFKGNGHGSNLLRIILEIARLSEFHAVMFRCFDKSAKMIKVLEKNSFELQGRDPDGAGIYKFY